MRIRARMDSNENLLPQLPRAHLQRIEPVINSPSRERTPQSAHSPLQPVMILPTSPTTDSGSNERGNCPPTDELSNKMAVVPFVPSSIQNSVDGGLMPRSGALTSSNIALASHRVCPTCLRPFYTYDGSTEEEDEALGRPPIDGAPSRVYPAHSRGDGRMFSPAYFRMLTMAMPLAIGDSPDDMAPQEASPASALVNLQRRKHARTTEPESFTNEEETASEKGGVAINPPSALPLCYYLSPTDSMPLDYTATEAYACGGSFFRPLRPPTALSPGGQRYASGQTSPSPPPTQTRETLPYPKEGSSGNSNNSSPNEENPENAAGNAQNSLFNAMTGLDGYYARYFIELQKLGSGTYGGVYLCQHVMEGVPLGTFALKKVPVGDNLTYLQRVLREVRILGEVHRHPNVVEYNHSWVETAQLADFGPPVRCLFILMEYATEGSLDAYMERHGTALTTLAVWYFFLSAVAGTAHLHRKNILHRDLKPQNLLLTGAPGTLPRVLVSDFGTAALLGDIVYERTGGTGTLEYMAPELLECVTAPRQETYLNRHTKASDTWSLGMILYYLACGATLPKQLRDGSVMLDIEAHSPHTRPPEMVQLIRAMLQRDPKRRPSCQDILQSTVAQTILRSFNSQSKIPQYHLFSQYVGSPCSQSGVGYDKIPADRLRPSQRFRDHKKEEDAEETYDEHSHLQSSKVELISTSTMMNIPLLMHYHTTDAMTARDGSNGSRDGREEGLNNVNSLLSLPSNDFPGITSTVKGPPENIQKPMLTKPRNGMSATWASPPFQRRNTVNKSVQTDP